MTSPPPMHQPETAAMTGFSVLIPTVGTQRHNSGRSVTSAPDENARSPVPVSTATRAAEPSNSAKACCNSTATALLIAFSFSGRLIAMTETGPRFSTVTTLISASTGFAMVILPAEAAKSPRSRAIIRLDAMPAGPGGGYSGRRKQEGAAMDLFKKFGVKDPDAAASRIPVIDFGPLFAGEPGALGRLAPQLRDACENVGFFYAAGHGVPEELIERAFAASRRFHALPLDEKLKLRLNGNNIGYLPINASVQGASTVHKATRPNQNESFFVSHDRGPERRHRRQAAARPQPVAVRAPGHPRRYDGLFRGTPGDVRPHAAALRCGA